MAKKKPAGVGAVGKAYAKFFHPKQAIQQKWPMLQKGQEVEGAIVLGKEVHRINSRMQNAYRVRIPEIDNGSEFWVVCKHFKVTDAGPTPFDDESHEPTPAAPAAASNIDPLRGTFDNVANNIGRGASADDIADLRAAGIEVDNEDIAPENEGEPPSLPDNVGEWLRPSICPRKANRDIQNLNGCWIENGWREISEMNELDLFRMTFPEQYILNTVIKETNKTLQGGMLDLQEFYVWLGCHFYMACFQGITDRRLWWSKETIDKFKGAPFRLGEYISFSRFRNIGQSIRYTDKALPEFIDRFHEVRSLIDAWNLHMQKNYCPSWLNCLDESMNTWLDKYCPGFMCVPRKPHPFGNEYHSIADGDGGKPIMWRVKLQEGKDRPKNANGSWSYPSTFEEKGYTKTACLMLEMTEPLHNTGKIVTMDSGFCVKVGIDALDEHGVYGQALVKKKVLASWSARAADR